MLNVTRTAQAKRYKPLLLIILDGWGIAQPGPYNAITQAKTPTYDYLWKNYPHTTLSAHGSYVGLPKGQVGNSEAGHMNLGAGRVVVQDSVYISAAIQDGTFFKNAAFLEAIHHVKQYNSQLHIMGILSGDQCPHMSPDHVIALSKLVYHHKIPVVWHFFTDGRDSLPHAAKGFWINLQKTIAPKLMRVGSVVGRFYLDRTKEWHRTEHIYNTLVLGDAKYQAQDLASAIDLAYRRGETDEFVQPTLIRNHFITASDNILDNDSIIFFNLRSDRARQLTKPFVQSDFEEANQGAFNRRKILRNVKFVALTDFGPDLDVVLTAFPAQAVSNTLPKVLGDYYEQLYVAEMEKYAHITYFLNGGYQAPIAGESRILVKSQPVNSYDEIPQMSSPEVTKVLLENLEHNWYNFVCVNLCNADMLGHTGNIKVARQGCEVVDKCLNQILQLIKSKGGEMVVTADHGNAEIMGRLTISGQEIINTTHETSPVPLIIYTNQEIKLSQSKSTGKPAGQLADVAPTLLDLANIPQPNQMSGQSLIVR